YRLNVMSFYLPPLRERVQDIEPLVRSLAARFNHKFKKELFDISAEALTALKSFPWPGNIRQLENAVQQAVLVSSGPTLLLEHFPKPVQEGVLMPNGDVQTSNGVLLRSREVLERTVIQRTLVNCNQSRARAAVALGISRVTLYKKMKK